MAFPPSALDARSNGAGRERDDAPKHGALGHLSADEELQQAVCSALIEDRELDSSHVAVRVAEGAVILSGSVRSRDDWMRALRIARAQNGTRSVRAEQLRIDDG